MATRDQTRAVVTQSERSDASRRTIIDAAIAILATEGYRRLTFNRIQETAGISRGLVSYHFSTKANLVAAVVVSVRDTYASEALAAVPDQVTGLESVLEMVTSYLGRLGRNPAPATVMLVLATTADATEPDVREAVRLRYAEMRAELGEWIRHGVADGSIRPLNDVPSTAAVIEGMVRGISLQYVVDRDGFDLDAAREAAREAVRHMLTAS